MCRNREGNFPSQRQRRKRRGPKRSVEVRSFELEIGHRGGRHCCQRNETNDFPRADSSGQSIPHYFDASGYTAPIQCERKSWDEIYLCAMRLTLSGGFIDVHALPDSFSQLYKLENRFLPRYLLVSRLYPSSYLHFNLLNFRKLEKY